MEVSIFPTKHSILTLILSDGEIREFEVMDLYTTSDTTYIESSDLNHQFDDIYNDISSIRLSPKSLYIDGSYIFIDRLNDDEAVFKLTK